MLSRLLALGREARNVRDARLVPLVYKVLQPFFVVTARPSGPMTNLEVACLRLQCTRDAFELGFRDDAHRFLPERLGDVAVSLDSIDVFPDLSPCGVGLVLGPHVVVLSLYAWLCHCGDRLVEPVHLAVVSVCRGLQLRQKLPAHEVD